jgi:hypothetical protein
MPTTPSDHRVLVVGDAGTPGVLLVHPWWGVTDAVRWWAHELAAAGRRVVVPDLYGGTVVTTTVEAEARADAAVADPATGELIGRLADELAATGQPWAAMGFSLGAFLACPLAARGDAGPEDLVLFYGGRPPAGRTSGPAGWTCTWRPVTRSSSPTSWPRSRPASILRGPTSPSTDTRAPATGSPSPACPSMTRQPRPWPVSGSSGGWASGDRGRWRRSGTPDRGGWRAAVLGPAALVPAVVSRHRGATIVKVVVVLRLSPAGRQLFVGSGAKPSQ